MEWKKVPISSICEGIYEGPHATPPSCESGAYYLGIPALTSDGQIDFSKVPRICEKDYKKWTKRVTPKYGDIVFTNEATLNLYARIPMDFYGCLGRRLGLVRPLQDKVDVDYLFYYFFSPYWRKVIALKKVSGSTVERILMKKFPHFPVLLPPLNIQNKIASILSDYDNLIENNNKRIRLLEQMAENLYKEWFVRFRFPGHEKADFENGLPKGWKRAPLKTICEFERGKNITASEMISGSVPVISAGVSPSGFHNKSNVLGSSVTISSSGANAGFISIHYEDIWAADCSFISEESTKYLYYVYELLNNMRAVVDNLQRGAAQPHVYPKDLNRLSVIVPSEHIREKANERFYHLHQLMSKLLQQNTYLSRQRDLLLPRLMSGKLEVKV